MKKMMSLLIVFNLVGGAALAEENVGTSDKTNGDNNNTRVSPAETMEKTCKEDFEKRLAGAAPTTCDYFYATARISDAQIGDNENASSSDRSVTCVQKYGYTVDYDACKKAVKLYDYVVITEKAMQMQQAARQTITNNKISKDVQQKTAEGNGQDAAWNATIKTNTNLANLNKEQAALYAASVSALSGGLSKWPGPNTSGYKRVCSSSAKVLANPKPDLRLHEVLRKTNCVDIIAKTKSQSKGALFANENAKAILMAKTTEFVQKGIAAGMNAAQLGQNAARMQAAQDQYEDQDMLLDKCVIAPTSAECMAPNVRSELQAYQGGSFNLGSGANTDNAFGNNPDDTFGIDGAATTGTGNVSDIKSPFEDEAKVASGILDPANAATITPGSAGAGAGSGGGGGGGGGGSASLGDDIKGAEIAGNKEADIKSNKYSGAYGTNGGGFQAIKSSKEDDVNPLAGLVDGNGGVEEDRSIASEGIGGQDSGLFQKISNKYSQIQHEKRIEANNLE